MNQPPHSKGYQEFIDNYLPHYQGKLNESISEKNAKEISRTSMSRWEERLAGPLELSRLEIDDCNDKPKPALRRFEVLMTWKDKKAKTKADTYGNFIDCCLRGEDTPTAIKICEVLEKEAQEASQQSNSQQPNYGGSAQPPPQAPPGFQPQHNGHFPQQQWGNQQQFGPRPQQGRYQYGSPAQSNYQQGPPLQHTHQQGPPPQWIYQQGTPPQQTFQQGGPSQQNSQQGSSQQGQPQQQWGGPQNSYPGGQSGASVPAVSGQPPDPGAANLPGYGTNLDSANYNEQQQPAALGSEGFTPPQPSQNQSLGSGQTDTQERGGNLSLSKNVREIPMATQLKVTKAHGDEIMGKGIRLAMIDQEFRQHQALNGATCYEVNASGTSCERKENGYFPKGSGCHGTRVAGVAAGRKVNPLFLFNGSEWALNKRHYPDGYPGGVAPEVDLTIFAARHKDDLENGDNKQVNCALDKIIELAGNEATRFHVLSMSFYIPDRLDTREKIKHLNHLGTIIISAAGNEGNLEDTFFPASMSEVVSVGALGSNGRPASYTSSAHPPTVYIHGSALVPSFIECTGPARFKTFASDNGTSIATPALAGLVCLIAQVTPEQHRKEVLQKDKLLKIFAEMKVIRSPEFPNSTFGINHAENFFTSCKKYDGYLLGVVNK